MLDTSAYAAFKRGQETAVSTLRHSPQILLPLIVIGELWAGFEFGRKRERSREELDSFLTNPRVSPVLIDTETAERYALIYTYLRQNDRPIPTNDLWIAALAMRHGARLLTADAHFQNLPQILVQMIPSSSLQ